MIKNKTQFNVQGIVCELIVSEDFDGDCTKMWHELVSVESGKTVATLHWSPYSCPSDAEVQQLIDLGLPRGLRWEHSNPGARFNFDSDSLALYLSEQVIHASHGKLELVHRK